MNDSQDRWEEEKSDNVRDDNVTRCAPSTFQFRFQCIRERRIIFIQAERLAEIVVPAVVPASELVGLFFEIPQFVVRSAPVFLILSVLSLPCFDPSTGNEEDRYLVLSLAL